MIADQIPSHPANNPNLEEGIYNAIIKQVSTGTYGDNQSPYAKVVFWLKEQDCFFVTHFYFPGNNAPGSKARLWYFSQSVGLDTQDVVKNPELFVDLPVRIEVCRVTPEDALFSAPYSDVLRFLPAHKNQQDILSAGPWNFPLQT